MKQQCIPKFLKGEISKYLCIIMEVKELCQWFRATPYMTKIMTMYDNIPVQNILQSYTCRDERLNGHIPTEQERFASKWVINNRYFYNDAFAKIYMDKYYPEGME